MSESAKTQVQTDRRRASRTALRLSATIREANRSKVEARLIDISTHGCRVEALFSASPEGWVWLSIAGLETQ
jgi:c-di-GMP-binding flagellar brake protein YcgR